MNQDNINQIIRWSARLVTLFSYIIICGMLVGGLGLIGLACVLYLFSRDGGAAMCFLSGCAFAAGGAFAMIRQLRGHSTHIRAQLQRGPQESVQA